MFNSNKKFIFPLELKITRAMIVRTKNDYTKPVKIIYFNCSKTVQVLALPARAFDIKK